MPAVQILPRQIALMSWGTSALAHRFLMIIDKGLVLCTGRVYGRYARHGFISGSNILMHLSIVSYIGMFHCDLETDLSAWFNENLTRQILPKVARIKVSLYFLM